MQPPKPVENQEQKENTTLKIVWTLLFALMYPVLITFSLLFTGLLWIFSALSWIANRILRLFSRNSAPKNGV